MWEVLVPCHRCGARQTDPAKGPSAWKRGVHGQQQVLVCPDCQRGRDWTADLDTCPRCGSTMLVRALGETSCRACGAQGVAPVPRATTPAGGPRAEAEREALATEVAAALSRVLGRS